MISRLGRFEIKAEIGRGGFGRVYLASDPVMNRVVAIKVLTASEDASSLDRFKNEATAAGNLRHENIVTVHEFGQEDQTPFLVMEYLDGENLQDVIRNQAPMSLYEKVRVMDQVAAGLHFAHRHGVLHRDIKPANIMVLKDGVVKIMDFGIARLMQDNSPRLTQQGYLIGTATYMAPELFAGTAGEVDSLCDIWSYGVVMYEFLAGKNPFQTGSIQSELHRILNYDPPALPADHCPPELEPILKKLLSRERESRYQSLEELRFELQPILKNLEKAEADRLVSKAQELMFQRRFDDALDLARQSRKLDPQNGTARVIFERAQEEQRKQSLQPRVDDLLRLSDEAAAQKRVPEAFAYLNSALKLDSFNENALSRLRSLRNLKMKLDEAATLIDEAGKEFHSGRLTDAFAHVSDAVSHDPDNAEAQQLLEKIQRVIQTRDVGRALDTEILRVRGLIAINDLNGALETLTAAESQFGRRADTVELAARIEQMIAERKKSQEYVGRLDQAKELLRTKRFEAAVADLQQIIKSFPEDRAAIELLAYAEHERNTRSRAGEVGKITAAVAELNRSQRFDEAIRIIEDGLKRYPEELSLTRLLRSTYGELQNFERERALRNGIKRCEEFCQRGQWREASDLITLLLSDNPNHAALTELAAKVKQAVSQTERAAAVRKAVERAEGFLRDEKPDLAVSVVESAILTSGAEPELAALQKKAKEAQQAERDRQSIDAELKHAKLFEERGDIPASLKIVDSALRRYPQTPELAAARERLSAAATGVHAEQEIAASIADIKESVDAKDWAAARQKLEKAAKLFPSESIFAILGEELNRRQNESQVAETAKTQSTGNVSVAAFPSAPGIPEALAEDTTARPGAKWRIYALAGVLLAGVSGLAFWMLRPAISITPAKLSFAYRAGSTPAPQVVTVSGSGSMQDPKPSVSWLKVSRRNAPSGKAAEFLVSIATLGLEPGNYTADLVFPSKKLPVELVVPPRTTEFQPTSLIFSYAAGTIPAQKIVVTSHSNIPDPKPSERWVAFTRHNLGPGKAEFDVRVLANGLTPGPHTAALEFAPDQKVPVVLTMPGGSTLEVYPAFLAFPAGGAQQKIVVTGPGVLPDPKPSERWVTVKRDNVSPGKAEFLVQVSPEGLGPGKKYASLVFSPDRKVQVELTIPGQATTIEIQPDSLKFQEGGGPQTISVTGPSDIPDPTSTDSWVTFTRNDIDTGRAEFAVQVSSKGLVPGPHVAYLAFSPQLQVRIELSVAVPKPLEVQPSELKFRYKRGGAPPQSQTVTVTGPQEIPDPTKKAPWLQWTRSGSGGKAQFLIQILPDKLGPDGGRDDLIFSPQKKVRIETMVLDTAENAPATSGTIFWSGGTLNPGDELWLKEKRVVEGPGAASGRLPKAEVRVDKSKLPAAVRIVEEPSSENGYVLRLVIAAGPPVYYLAIPWTLKK